MEVFNTIDKIAINILSNKYNNKLLDTIKDKFTTEHQKLFVTSFYCYMNYKKNDFVIDLDDLRIWLDFKKKVSAKDLLEKHFINNVDYKILNNDKEKNKHGGHNKEIIMLTIDTFKLYCIKNPSYSSGF